MSVDHLLHFTAGCVVAVLAMAFVGSIVTVPIEDWFITDGWGHRDEQEGRGVGRFFFKRIVGYAALSLVLSIVGTAGSGFLLNTYREAADRIDRTLRGAIERVPAPDPAEREWRDRLAQEMHQHLSAAFLPKQSTSHFAWSFAAAVIACCLARLSSVLLHVSPARSVILVVATLAGAAALVSVAMPGGLSVTVYQEYLSREELGWLVLGGALMASAAGGVTEILIHSTRTKWGRDATALATKGVYECIVCGKDLAVDVKNQAAPPGGAPGQAAARAELGCCARCGATHGIYRRKAPGW